MRADKRKYHYIYKITRTFDNRFYIGMHSTDNLEDGYFGSGKLITRSVKKHGVDKHSKEILEYVESRELLKLREREIVNQELIDDLCCMNLQLGGGSFTSDDAKRNWKIPGYREKISVAVSINTRKRYENLENRRKLAESMKLERAKDYSRFKPKKNWQGLKHSEETRAKMRSSHKGLQDGEKNSNFGKCWVTDGVKPISIKKEQLDEYLAKGYSKGRKYSDESNDNG